MWPPDPRTAPADERYDEMMDLLQWGSTPTYEQAILNEIQMREEDAEDEHDSNEEGY